MLALIGNLGPLETALIALIVILVFGGRLPEVARQAMRMMARVRGALDEIKGEVDLDGELRQINADIRRESARKMPPPVTIDQAKGAEPDVKRSPETDERTEVDQ